MIRAVQPNELSSSDDSRQIKWDRRRILSDKIDSLRKTTTERTGITCLEELMMDDEGNDIV